jgi:hypothetical protein
VLDGKVLEALNCLVAEIPDNVHVSFENSDVGSES